jgi:hypothetical protein
MDQEELRQLLAEMYAEHKELDPGYSYAKVGRDLAKMIGRQEGPYTKGYIYAVCKGQKGYPVSPELADGLRRLGAVQDGMTEFQAKLQAVPSGVLSMYEVPSGAVIMGQARLCATTGCGLRFVSDNPRRRFCPKCRPARIRT